MKLKTKWEISKQLGFFNSPYIKISPDMQLKLHFAVYSYSIWYIKYAYEIFYKFIIEEISKLVNTTKKLTELFETSKERIVRLKTWHNLRIAQWCVKCNSNIYSAE